ncbi:MAG: hypothetical protein ABI315_05660 [Bacteroidia bacterium]
MKNKTVIQIALVMYALPLFIFGIYNIVDYKDLAQMIVFNWPLWLKVGMVFSGAFILLASSVLITLKKYLNISCISIILLMMIYILIVHIQNPYHDWHMALFMLFKDINIAGSALLIKCFHKQIETL